MGRRSVTGSEKVQGGVGEEGEGRAEGLPDRSPLANELCGGGPAPPHWAARVMTGRTCNPHPRPRNTVPLALAPPPLPSKILAAGK